MHDSFLYLPESGQSNPAFLTEPEANLLLAIIHLALSDANQPIPPKPKDKRYNYRWQAKIDARREARAWLRSKICAEYLELLGSSQQAFERHLKKHYSWARETLH
jgi:hypothetical protein